MEGLKRVLGLPAVAFIAIGFTIGGGVFVFTEIVLKIAGPALPLAYALAVIPVFISMLPIAMLGSAIPCTGANYKYPSRMVSPRLAFVGIWVYVLASFVGQIPLYAISCAKYASVLFPGLPVVTSALLILTVFYLVNLFGVRIASLIQGIMVILLIGALFFYGVRGLGHFHPENFTAPFQKGVGNLLLGTALLTFTYFGSNGIIELGGEIKNPGWVIPRALFIAFPIITILYLLAAVATSGCFPLADVVRMNDPLATVARETCGRVGFFFFIGCGAILAILTTLNALFIVGTKSLLIIIADGILPQWMGRINTRFGTAHILLTLIWLFSLLGVLIGFELQTLASYAALGGMIIFVPVLLASIKLPALYPEEYARSLFKLKGFWLWFCPAVGFLMVAFFSLIILIDLKSPVKTFLFILFLVSGIAYYEVRRGYLQKRGIDLNSIRGRSDWYE